MDAPIVTYTLTTVTTVPAGQSPDSIRPQPPSLASLPPAVWMAPVEHQIVFDDFKAVEGLNWPHRFTRTAGGSLHSTMTVRKYKLNPKIDPRIFDPARR
jgi:hypothetical protein